MQKQLSFHGQTILAIAGVVIILSGIKAASAIAVPFLLATFIAIICNPLVNRLSKGVIPRGVAILLVLLIVVIMGLVLAGVVGQSLSSFSAELPVYEKQVQAEFIGVATQLAELGIVIDKELITKHFDPGSAMSLAAGLLSGFGNVMANGFLIFLTVVFMLLEAPTVAERVHLALSDPKGKMKAIDNFLQAVNDYLSIKTIVSLITGVVIGVLLWIMGVKYVILWGLLAFLFNYIPNIGSIIAAVPAVLLTLVTHGPLFSGITALIYVFVNVVMGNVIEPRFMGKGLGLSTLVVFLSLIFWGWLLGTVGMLLSVPLTMIVKIGLETNEGSKRFANLMSSAD